MSKVKLDEKIYWADQNRYTTIDELAKEGLIDFKKVEMHSSRTKSGYSIRYFADLKGTMIGWEIGKFAYLSRTNQTNELNN